jgi:hypothetical protein
LRVAGTGRADFVHPVVPPRKRVGNNQLDRTTRWTCASKLATVHHVAGQPGPFAEKPKLENGFVTILSGCP